MNNVSVIESIGSANPEHSRSQSDAADFMERVESIPDPIRSRIRAIYDRSGIDIRHSCIADYEREPDQFKFYPGNWRLEPQPSTEKRNALYRNASVSLAVDAASKALDQSDSSAADITHVITVSCTGFFAPGLDIELCNRLGLSRSVERVHIGFMGCYAAFNALKTAHAFCQSNPQATVLIACVELCTLHFQISDTMEKAVINSLFSDGAAAVVMSSQPASGSSGKMIYDKGLAVLDDSSLDYMTWDLGNTGFNMGLSRKVPDVISGMLPDYIESLLGMTDLARSDIDFWAVHPGGRAVVEKAAETLSLSEEDTFDSYETLRLHGNMSSPTILFIMERKLQQLSQLRNGVALAFGPGLTIEGCLLRVLP